MRFLRRAHRHVPPLPSPRVSSNVAGIALGNRFGILLGALLKRARWLIRAILRANAGTIRSQPERYFDQLARQMCPTDERIARSAEFRSNFHRELLEAYRNGVEGHVDETGILSDPWGFDPGAIKVPVEIWHGEDDTLAPVAMGRAMHDLIPGSRLNVVPGRGHLLRDEEPSWRAVLQAAQGKIANA